MNDLSDHPRWQELEDICHRIEILKGKSKKLRELIEKDFERDSGGNQDGSQENNEKG